MKLWELKEKLNALSSHDNELDVFIATEEGGEYRILDYISSYHFDKNTHFVSLTGYRIAK